MTARMQSIENAPEIEALPEPSRSLAKQLLRELLDQGHAPREAIGRAVQQAAQDAAERARPADAPSANAVDDAKRRAEAKLH